MSLKLLSVNKYTLINTIDQNFELIKYFFKLWKLNIEEKKIIILPQRNEMRMPKLYYNLNT